MKKEVGNYLLVIGTLFAVYIFLGVYCTLGFGIGYMIAIIEKGLRKDQEKK